MCLHKWSGGVEVNDVHVLSTDLNSFLAATCKCVVEAPLLTVDSLVLSGSNAWPAYDMLDMLRHALHAYDMLDMLDILDILDILDMSSTVDNSGACALSRLPDTCPRHVPDSLDSCPRQP